MSTKTTESSQTNSQLTKTEVAQNAESRRLLLDMAQQQLSDIRTQSAFQTDLFGMLPALFNEQTAAGAAAGDVSAGIAPQQADLLQQYMTLLSNGQGVTPEQAALIDEATNAAFGVGASQITSSATDAARSIGQQLTPNLGLRGTDTPIQDRGALLSMATATQLGQLAQGLSGANAQARLAYPLQANAQQVSQLGEQQQFLESVRQFQSSLQQQAFANRLNLTGQTGELGLGLISGAPGAQGAASVNNNLSRLQLGPGSSGAEATTSDPLGTAADIFGALGALGQGYSAVVTS